MIGTFGDYPEYRQTGWTHDQIVNFTRNPDSFLHELKKTKSIRSDKILCRVKKTLKI